MLYSERKSAWNLEFLNWTDSPGSPIKVTFDIAMLYWLAPRQTNISVNSITSSLSKSEVDKIIKNAENYV